MQSVLGELKLSRLMLGTVQFGTPYGVANRDGQPDYATVRAILECAFEGGINCLDTAAAYGTSEEVLGRALEEMKMVGQAIVVTKVRPLPDDLGVREADEAVEASVANSLRQLRVERVPVCLFHREENARYLESLHRLQTRGWIEHLGVSALTVEGAKDAVRYPDVSAIQMPGNVLDRRFLGGVPLAAQEQGIGVFVRSVFLQGLLLMPEADIAPELGAVIPIRRRLSELAHLAGISLAELIARYVLSCQGVTCALIGVDSVAQMRENLALFAQGRLSPDLVAAIESVVPPLPDSILNPFKWPQRTPVSTAKPVPMEKKEAVNA